MTVFQRTIDGLEISVKLPSTRYLGSKRKMVKWIWENVRHLSFDSFLDIMGGTGVVGFCAKRRGKRVLYNDILKFNYQVGVATIENGYETITPQELALITSRHGDIPYPSFIEDTFSEIYYTDEENAWLDMVITNIDHFLRNRYKRALAWAALGQACLVKRPFNLFHRKNLYLRFQHVSRSFGNKTTWDTPFPAHFVNFVREYNSLVFDNGRDNKALNCDVFDLDIASEAPDLVYIDPPYLPVKGDKPDYHLYYHFLEGMVDYVTWPQMINGENRIKPMRYTPSPWTNGHTIYDAFDRLFQKLRDVPFIVLSYNSEGVPSQEELFSMLRKYKRNVDLAVKEYQYVLSKQRPKELLFAAY